MKRKAKKNFDALAFKAKVQAEILNEIRGMTHAEEIEYMERRAESGPMGDWVREVKKATLERKQAEIERKKSPDAS